MVRTKYVEDEEGSASSSDHDPISASFRAAVSMATSVDLAFIDPFVSNDQSSNGINATNARKKKSELDTCVEMGEESEESMFYGHASFQKSFRSLDFSESYLNAGAAGSYSNRVRGSFEQKQLRLKRALYGLFFLDGLLAILSASSKNFIICSYLNLIVTAAMGAAFVVYDSQGRQHESFLIQSITKSEAIVNSLFPEIVRDRILEEGNWNLKPAPLRSGKVESAPVAHEEKQEENHRNEANGRDDSNHTYTNSGTGSNTDDSTLKIDSVKLTPSPTMTHKKILLSSPPKRRRSYHSTSSNETDHDPHGNSNVHSNGDYILDASQRTHRHHSHHSRSGNAILSGSNHSSQPNSSSRPIADYFPSATIMFADIVGFTSWASIREPAQVFELLETVYGRFDRIAQKKGVFKVETIGDCYVAATGLPNAMNDHAVAMASFARRCLETMLETVAELEESLGPGTADLGMRVGIHSGSVIGGVLRGSKSRYQLFGDTMNTASRIESTSIKNKIQLSEQTAELIIEAGKKPWVEPRGETIFAKGKGELTTYWLSTEGPKNLTANEAKALPALLKMMEKANIDPGFIKKKKVLDPSRKRKRLVDYHTNVLKGLLKRLAAIRDDSDISFNTRKVETLSGPSKRASVTKTFTKGAIPDFPTYMKVGASTEETDLYTIDASVSKQLRELISRVSRWYSDDKPFHTFEHASHTVLSITKFVSAIKTNDSADDVVLNVTKSMIIHPLTQFVLIFAALVHETGDGNVDESRFVAADKSTRRAWSLFSEPAFNDLRNYICKNRHDMEFFRCLLGKCIAAVKAESTDAIQKSYEGEPIDWSRPGNSSSSMESQVASSKAMAIVETVLRVSDVSYAIQHFPVFKKWNKLLFQEVHAAYKSKCNTDDDEMHLDPSVTWYESELESFDDRILLVRELRDTGVFNKLADVYLSTAIANRREWKQKGEQMVQEYLFNSKRRNS